MIERTFRHLDGLGSHSERALWKQGCLCWKDFLDEPDKYSPGSIGRDGLRQGIDHSLQALAEGDYQFFAQGLTERDHWRCWEAFKEKVLYLDIETDGGQSGNAITVIGMADSSGFFCLTKDEGLGAFPDILSRYSMIVTFWGSGFDLPMLNKAFPGLHRDQLHLDLCYAFRGVGMRGGLKSIEKQLGLARSDETDGLTGRDAITLWNRYERYGDQKAKDTLIAYNKEDVVNMEVLAQIAFDRLTRHTLAEAGIILPSSKQDEASS